MGCRSPGDCSRCIGLLRTRFGNELQAERFKAELKVRRRRTGESLQQLYQDISKLVALAHPNEGPALVNHVPKEAFVIALSDPILQLKVIEHEPKTVEDALNIAVKMEAYQASVVPPESGQGSCGSQSQAQGQIHVCRGRHRTGRPGRRDGPEKPRKSTNRESTSRSAEAVQ